jgi:predicted metal-dependent phosphotriesterase family hydrolase
MRKLFVLGVAVALLLSVAAVASAAPKKDPPGKIYERQPTPEAVTYEHIDALNACDVDRLMAQYPESIHIILPGGVTIEGRDAVRDLFEGFCDPVTGLRGLQFTEVAHWKVHKTINMQWEADADFLCEPYLGADAYETWAGLMAAQVTTFDGNELKFHGDPDCPVYHTTHGALTELEVGNILSHQHMFVEFQAAPPVAYLTSTFAEVWAAIGDMVLEAKDLGYDVFIEPTPLGVGRRPDIVEQVALEADLPTMMPTGIYHEPYQPTWVAGATVDELTEFMLEELNVGVGDTNVQAGFIKLASSYTNPTETELKVLEAACNASLETGAAIASHILTSTAVQDTMDALEGFGCPLDRFIWIHAPYTAFIEGDAGVDALLAAAERGAYLSHDFIGSQFWIGWVGDNSYERHFELLDAMVEAGYEDQLLIGSDTGWFDPGNPGFLIEPYNQIMDDFVPFMQDQGYSDELIDKFLHENPWEAYSR